MKRLPLVGFIALTLAGCTQVGDLLDALLFGHKHNVALLLSKEADLSQQSISLAPLSTAEVVGGFTAVCVVLGHKIPGKNFWQDEAGRLLDESKLQANVLTSDGATHELSCPSIGWAANGKVFPSDEVESCVRLSCSKQKMSIGSKVQSVSISSKSPIHIFGAYWESTNAFDHDN